MGCSVTQRIKLIKQPRGGYLPHKLFKQTYLDDKTELFSQELENIHASTVGLAVDYMSRFMLNNDLEEAFEISLIGAKLTAEYWGVNEPLRIAKTLLNDITGLDDKSIISACKLTIFDQALRAGICPTKSDFSDLNPNQETIFNIKTMVLRSLTFFKTYGPLTQDGFTMEGGYTAVVSSGDGDFLTQDTLWDFKVKKVDPTKSLFSSKETLQVLMYYVMGMHSIHNKTLFKNIKYLGFFNPRRNVVSRVLISEIPTETIKQVEFEVIGYSQSYLK